MVLSEKLNLLQDGTQEPEKYGFDPEKIQYTEWAAHSGLPNRIYPAVSWLVMRENVVIAKGADVGLLPETNAPLTVDANMIFDVASITKMFTAVLLLQCVEAGGVHLGQKLGEFLPDADGSPVAKLTLKQLATHTSGLPPWAALHASKRGHLAEIFATPLTSEPGTRYAYSDLGYILLGEILHRITGDNLVRLTELKIFQLCGMTRTGYNPAASLRTQIAPTANCPVRSDKILIGEVHDANAWSLGGVAGHAGVFSTAADLARFSLGLQSGALLSPAALRLLQQNQIAPEIGGHSIGAFTVPNPMLPRGDLLSTQTFGHTGFTGTLFLCDPENRLTLILLTNRVYFPQDNGGISKIRRQFANAVAGAML